jgi:hypothetical protein
VKDSARGYGLLMLLDLGLSTHAYVTPLVGNFPILDPNHVICTSVQHRCWTQPIPRCTEHCHQLPTSPLSPKTPGSSPLLTEHFPYSSSRGGRDRFRGDLKSLYGILVGTWIGKHCLEHGTLAAGQHTHLTSSLVSSCPITTPNPCMLTSVLGGRGEESQVKLVRVQNRTYDSQILKDPCFLVLATRVYA